MTTPKPATKRTVKRAKPLPSEGVEAALDVIETPDEVIPPTVDESGVEIPADLQFVTPARGDESEEVSEDDLLEFTVDGEVLIAIKPNAEQWGMLTALIAKSATFADRAHGLQTFASYVLDEPSFLYVQTRLLDRNDTFGGELLGTIIDKLIKHWAPEQTTTSRAARRQAARRAARR